MKAPTPIDVLMPVRCGGVLLKRALSSLDEQNAADFNIIVVTDQADPATLQLLDHWSQNFCELEIIPSPPPHGLVAALNAGIAACSAPLIARMDADDWAHPERLRLQRDFLEARPHLAACGCQVRILGSMDGPFADPSDGMRRYEAWLNACTDPDQIRRERFIESPLVHPSVMIRRSALDRVGGYRDAGWAEDYDLWLRLLEAGEELGKVPQVLLHWQDGPDRLTRTDGLYSEEAFLRAKAHFLARVPEIATQGCAVSGTGKQARLLARFLQEQGVRVEAFYDVNARRVGHPLEGLPVRAALDMPRTDPSQPVQLLCVGREGRRDPGRKLLESLGYKEGKTFYCVA